MPNDMADARAAKVRAEAERKKSLAVQVQEILADSSVNDELKRKLRYCQEELQRRPGHDGLVKRRSELLDEVKRRF